MRPIHQKLGDMSNFMRHINKLWLIKTKVTFL